MEFRRRTIHCRERPSASDAYFGPFVEEPPSAGHGMPAVEWRERPSASISSSCLFVVEPRLLDPRRLALERRERPSASHPYFNPIDPVVEERALPGMLVRYLCGRGGGGFATAAPTIPDRLLEAERRRALEDEIRRELAYERAMAMAIRRFEVVERGRLNPRLTLWYTSSSVPVHSEVDLDRGMLLGASMLERYPPLTGSLAHRDMVGLEPRMLPEPRAECHHAGLEWYPDPHHIEVGTEGLHSDSRARTLPELVGSYSQAGSALYAPELGYQANLKAGAPLHPQVDPEQETRLQSARDQFEGSMKRKAPAIMETTEEDQRPVKKKWGCALCKVIAPCKEGLDAHLQGKKHKAREAALVLGKKRTVEEASVDYSKAVGKKAIGSTSATNQTNKRPTSKKLKRAKKLRAIGKKHLWCEVCKLQCNSQIMMASHLRGKKHAELKEANRTGKPTSSES